MTTTLSRYLILSVCSTLILSTSTLLGSEIPEWQQCGGYYSGAIRDIVQVDSILLGHSLTGIYRLEKGTSKWLYSPLKLTDIFNTMLNHKSEVFAGGTNNVYHSSDKGISWQTYGSFPLESMLYKINNLSYTNSTLFAGTSGGIFQCNPNTKEWTRTLDVKTIGSVDALWAENDIAVAHGDSGIFRTINSGKTWQYVSADSLPENGYLASSIIKFNGKLYISYNYFKGGIFASDDLGLTWSKVNGGLSELAVINLWNDGNNIFAKVRNGILYRLNELTWQKIVIPNESNVLTVLESGIYTHDNYINRSIDGGHSWQKLLVWDIVLNQLVPTDNSLIGAGNYSVIYVSDSSGNVSKRKIASWIGANEYGKVIYHKKNLYSSTNTGIYKSSNLGDSWVLNDPFSSQYPPPHYYPLVPYIIESYGLSAFFPEYYTTTDDKNWTRIGDSPGKAVRSGVLAENNFFLLVGNTILRRSSSGNYLDVTGTLSGNTIKDVKAKNNTLFVSTTDGIWRSTDLAKNWEFVGLKNKDIESIVFLGTNTFTCGRNAEIFYSPDNGNSWKEILKPESSQDNDNYAYTLGIYKKRLYVSTENGVFTLNLPTAKVSHQLLPPNGFITNSESIRLVWNTAENAVSYHLQVSTTNEFPSTPFLDKQYLTDTSYTLRNLTSGTTYYWRIKSIGMDGGEKEISKSDIVMSENDWSPIYSFAVGSLSNISNENSDYIPNMYARYNDGIITITLPEYCSFENISCSISTLRGKVYSPNKVTFINNLQIQIEEHQLSNGLYTIIVSNGNKYFRYVCFVYDN